MLGHDLRDLLNLTPPNRGRVRDQSWKLTMHTVRKGFQSSPNRGWVRDGYRHPWYNDQIDGFQSSPNRGRVSDPPQKFVMRIKGLQGRLHFVGLVIAILPAFIFECRSEPRCFANDFIALHALHFLHGGMRVSAFRNRKCKTIVIRSFI